MKSSKIALERIAKEQKDKKWQAERREEIAAEQSRKLEPILKNIVAFVESVDKLQADPQVQTRSII